MTERSKVRAIIFRTEANGMESKEVIQIGWSEVFDSLLPEIGTQGRSFEPTGRWELGAVATHGILPSDVKGCTPSSEAPAILPEAEYLIAHNVDFDCEAIGDTHSKHGGMRPPGTVWGVPSDGPHLGRITGAHSNKERCPDHPNQLPIRYMQRFVIAYTKPGDWVLDPFVGSGTTGLVSKHEGRNFVGIDVSEFSVTSSRNRIESGFYRPIV